jgi:hypothetical protein
MLPFYCSFVVPIKKMNDHRNTQPTQTIKTIEPTHSQVPRTLEELVWLFSAVRGERRVFRRGYSYSKLNFWNFSGQYRTILHYVLSHYLHS